MVKIKSLGVASLAGLFCALTLSACEFSVSTASIGTVSASKEKGGASVTTFGESDKVYARAETKHVSDGTKLKWRAYATNVEGMPPNTELNGADVTVDLVSGAEFVDYNVGPPGNGWPVGTYKLEATLLLEGGKQKEQKSIDITIKGS